MTTPHEHADFELTSLRQLLDAGVPMARAALRTIFWPIALPVVTVTTLAGVVQMRLLQRFFPLAQSEPDASAMLDLMSMSMNAVVLSLLMMGVMAVAFAALSAAVMDILAGRPADMKRAWRTALQPSMVWTVGLCLMFSFLSALACVVPALFVVPLLALVVPLAVSEGARGMDAVSRGISLLRARPEARGSDRPQVRSFVVLLVTFTIAQALALVAQGPFMILQQVWLTRDLATGSAGVVSDATLWLHVPMSLLGGLAQVLAWVYAAFTLGLLYQDVQRRNEGADLAQAIAALESQGLASESAPAGSEPTP